MADDTKKEEKKQEAEIQPEAEIVKEEKKGKDLSPKLSKIASNIEELTVLELADLASYLEDKFGVTAMPAMAMPAGGMATSAGSGEADVEEKTKFTVSLQDAGGNKLGVIKAVRELRQDLGLMDAKKLVEEAPKDLLTDVKKEEAEEAVKKLTEAGAKAEMK